MKTKSFILLIIGFLLILGASAQDLPDHSKSDPDNVSNRYYDTSQTPTWEEVNQKISDIIDSIKSKPVKGIRKDMKDSVAVKEVAIKEAPKKKNVD